MIECLQINKESQAGDIKYFEFFREPGSMPITQTGKATSFDSIRIDDSGILKIKANALSPTLTEGDYVICNTADSDAEYQLYFHIYLSYTGGIVGIRLTCINSMSATIRRTILYGQETDVIITFPMWVNSYELPTGNNINKTLAILGFSDGSSIKLMLQRYGNTDAVHPVGFNTSEATYNLPIIRIGSMNEAQLIMVPLSPNFITAVDEMIDTATELIDQKIEEEGARVTSSLSKAYISR